MIRKTINVVIVFLFILVLTSCLNIKKNTNNIDTNEKNDKIEGVLKGSYINLNDEIFKIYYNKEIKEYDNIDALLTYNKYSNNYVKVVNNKIYLSTKENDFMLEEDIEKIQLSNKGKNLMYLKNSEILETKVLDVNSNNEYDIYNNAIISGDFIRWISDKEIVYYGIDIENSKNGLFIYNIDTREEKLLYDIKIGYIEYIKNIDDKVIFVENNFENKIVREINNKGEVNDIAKDIIEVSDIVKSKNEYYILGKNKDNLYSLYKTSSSMSKRMIYDFPYIIDMEGGLSVGEDGEILFIGSNESLDKKYIYKYIDGKISKLTDNSGEYRFINYN